ncbi:hypothetical protein [Streptomyces sp. MUSC 14]|nr:hypothetical protein [Streptomyces sp. MUSC 14]
MARGWGHVGHSPVWPTGTRVPTDFLRLHEAAYAPIAAGQSLIEGTA